MGEQSSTVAWQKVDRMILVYLLVLVYSLRGCLGVHRSEAVWDPQDIVGNLGLLTKFSDNELVSASSSRGYDPSKQLVIRDVPYNELNSADQDNQNRELSLKMLLENLAKLRNLSNKGSHIKARTAENSNRRGQYRLSEKQIRISPSQIQHIYPPELLSRYNGDFRLRNEPSQSNTLTHVLSPLSGEGHKQLLPSARRAGVFHNLNNHLYTDLIVLREPVTSENKDVQTSHNDFHKRTKEEELNMYDSESKEVMNTDLENSLQLVRDEENKVRYLFTPVNYLSGKDDAEPLNSHDTPLNAAKSKSVEISVTHHGEVWNEVNTIKTHGDDVLSGRNADTVSSLIFKAVKKMESIVNKRVYQYDTFLTTVQQLPDETSEIVEDDSLSNENSTWLNGNEHLASIDNAESDELLAPDNTLPDEDAGSVIKEVIKAVADRKVPKDIRFWQKLSHYLDSSDYRRRAKRSPERRRHKGHRYVHLSITYGHVMPCEHKDRFYCMNGGTCVFVGALDIRTCRCPIGYTGVRCELIDQEYILSLLTNTLIFS